MVDRSEPALGDILDEIEWISRVTAGRRFEDFVGDRVLRYAVERSIEIISEASRRIAPEAKALAPDVPWRAIGGIGNILRHEYHATAPRLVWDVVVRDLADLHRAVETIRAAIGPREG